MVDIQQTARTEKYLTAQSRVQPESTTVADIFIISTELDICSFQDISVQ